MTRILGIDPGSVITGVGIVDCSQTAVEHVHHTCIKTGKGDFPDRLRVIFEQLTALIQEYQPDEIAVESVFVSKNADSALKLGQARGAAICAAVAMQKAVFEYTPRHVKQAVVGRGSAEKQQVQHMIGILLNLRGPIQNDAADALGIAVCRSHHRQTESRLGAHRSLA